MPKDTKKSKNSELNVVTFLTGGNLKKGETRISKHDSDEDLPGYYEEIVQHYGHPMLYYYRVPDADDVFTEFQKNNKESLRCEGTLLYSLTTSDVKNSFKNIIGDGKHSICHQYRSPHDDEEKSKKPSKKPSKSKKDDDE